MTYPLRRFACIATGAALALAIPHTASAQPFYSTGVHLTGGVVNGDHLVGAIDQHWLVATGYGQWSSTFEAAHAWYHPDKPGFYWITDGGPRMYQWFTFRQLFDLSAYDPLSVSLAFRWACDDLGAETGYDPQFSVNGGAWSDARVTPCGGYNVFARDPITLTSGFVGGQNYIDFRVKGNYATNGMGVLVTNFSAQPVTVTTPEPATVGLMVTGLVALAVAARRRPG